MATTIDVFVVFDPTNIQIGAEPQWGFAGSRVMPPTLGVAGGQAGICILRGDSQISITLLKFNAMGDNDVPATLDTTPVTWFPQDQNEWEVLTQTDRVLTLTRTTSAELKQPTGFKLNVAYDGKTYPSHDPQILNDNP